MIKVQTIWGNYLSNTIGPSQTLKRFIRNNQKFANNNIDFSVLSLDVKFDLTESGTKSELKKENYLLNLIKKIQKFRIINYLSRNTIFFAFISFYFKYLRHSISIFRKWKALNDSSADIIVFHDPITYYVFKKTLIKQKLKVVLFHHGDDLEQNMFYDYYPVLQKIFWIKKNINKFTLNSLLALDTVVFINPISYHNAKIKYVSLSDKFRLVQNGIDDLNPNNIIKRNYEDGYKIVTTGTLNERKNQLLILQALKEAIPKLKYKVKVIIVGDGPLLKKLIDYSNSNNLNQYVEFVGNQKNVSPFLLNANIFMLSSNKEGLPLAVVEALSFELPIISSNIAGIGACVVDAKNGILYPPKNKKALANLFCSLDKHDWQHYGSNSRKLFKTKFQFSQMQDSYINLISELYCNNTNSSKQ
jgi:glycosyltransferase involved in cell wall biosynthesis